MILNIYSIPSNLVQTHISKTKLYLNIIRFGLKYTEKAVKTQLGKFDISRNRRGVEYILPVPVSRKRIS